MGAHNPVVGNNDDDVAGVIFYAWWYKGCRENGGGFFLAIAKRNLPYLFFGVSFSLLLFVPKKSKHLL